MSGGSYSTSDLGYPSGDDSCDELNFTASLNSPNAKILSLLKKGDILQITLDESKGTKFIAVLYKDDIAGSIIERVAKLATCIKNGHSYEAEVRLVSGGRVEIDVRPQ